MAIDAGQFWLTSPANVQATDAALCAAGNVTSAGDKAFFMAQQRMEVVEVGAMIGTATAATTYNFTVATAPNIGGTYVVQATLTGPAATIIAAGASLKKQVRFTMEKGDILRFTVLATAPASGSAQFYAVCNPAGSVGIGPEDLISTT